jgi:hypothetical protein
VVTQKSLGVVRVRSIAMGLIALGLLLIGSLAVVWVSNTSTSGGATHTQQLRAFSYGPADRNSAEPALASTGGAPSDAPAPRNVRGPF